MAGTTETDAPSSGLDVAIRTAEVGDVWSRDQVNLLLREYAAKGTTVDEFSAFLLIAKRYKLDPFTHEIWLPDFDGTGQSRAPYVGRDGLLAIAERSGQYDGMLSGVVYDGDEFELDVPRPVHRISGREPGAKIRFSYAYVYRKDRSVPSIVLAPREEFLDPKVYDDKGNLRTGGVTKTPWFRFPSLMLKKVAEANALRLAFKVSGVVAVADNATPVDAGDVIDGEAIEMPDEPHPDLHAPGSRPAQTGAPDPPLDAAGPAASAQQVERSPTETDPAAATIQARLDQIGRAPLAGHPVDGEMLKHLVDAAKPMKRADLLRVAKWATRADSWPTMALVEVDHRRAIDLIAYFESTDADHDEALEALSAAVVDWETEKQAAGDDPEQGTLA